MKKSKLVILLLGLIIAMSFNSTIAGPNDIINGAGATFPYPLYSQWAFMYNKETQTRLNYQSIGSGGGIRQIIQGTVDFGASDAPMKVDELEKNGFIQFPAILGGVVPAINVKGIGKNEMMLDDVTLVNIYLGKIKKWNDPAIAKLNPNLKLPNRDITVVHRSDGSGTTWIFVNYLAAVSKEWAEKVGAASSVQWPTGVGGKGNEGVASYVQQIDGAIGYVEYAYALQNNIPTVRMKNRDGNYVKASLETFQAAAGNADWKNAPGFYKVLVDQPGAKSWPITGASFIIVHINARNNQTARENLNFWNWCFKNGQKVAEELHYVPIPVNVVQMIHEHWKTHLKTSTGTPLWQ